MSIAAQYDGAPLTPYFVNNLGVRMLGLADLWIHGHTHAAFDYNINNSRVISNPSGYAFERSGFNPDLIVEVN